MIMPRHYDKDDQNELGKNTSGSSLTQADLESNPPNGWLTYAVIYRPLQNMATILSLFPSVYFVSKNSKHLSLSSLNFDQFCP